MSTTDFPVAVYTPRTPALLPHRLAVARGAGTLEMSLRTDSLGFDVVDEPTIRTRTSPVAIAAAVCGLLGFLHGAGFVAGIMLGHLALRMIKRSNGRVRGRRLAQAALLVSWTPLVLAVAVFVVMFLIGLHIAINSS